MVWVVEAMVTVGVRGFSGCTGRACARYHANTGIFRGWKDKEGGRICTFVAVLGGVGGSARNGEAGRREEELEGGVHVCGAFLATSLRHGK